MIKQYADPRGDARSKAVKTVEPPQASVEDAVLVKDEPIDVDNPGRAGLKWAKGIEPYTTIWIGALHVGALLAPFYFSWAGVITAAFLIWATASLGICLGYHRLLTHRSFETFRWVKRTFATVGTLAGEGPPVFWVASHRQHHRFSDQDGDPHSPEHGFWWSHALWLSPKMGAEYTDAIARKYAPDLLKDPYIRVLTKSFLWWQIGLGALLLAFGWTVWDFRTGCSLVVWGMFFRLVYVLHITWLVNSASHMWGYRNYETTDNSRNLWWVGLLAFGEGWHNNHHAFQRMAPHGHKAWEIDPTYWVICLMERVGLVWNVVRDVPGFPGRQPAVAAVDASNGPPADASSAD